MGENPPKKPTTDFAKKPAVTKNGSAANAKKPAIATNDPKPKDPAKPAKKDVRKLPPVAAKKSLKIDEKPNETGLKKSVRSSSRLAASSSTTSLAGGPKATKKTAKSSPDLAR